MRKKESGFSLVEMSIVLVIIGLAMAMMVSLFQPYVETAKINATTKKMEGISRALEMFAQDYGRLPCPGNPLGSAEPFGSPRSSGSDGSDIYTQICGANEGHHIGIVPFKAIGLTESQVTDEYGRLFTYAVSPALTTHDPSNPNHSTVNSACTTSNWMQGSLNRNINKAKLCCPNTHTLNDLQVLDNRTSGKDMFVPGRINGVINGGYSNSVAIQPQLVAFVLVSHGKNGDGAFQRMSSTQRSVTVSATAQELANRDGDFKFVSRPYNLAQDDNYFDDIVLWKTNTQLVTDFGIDSCSKP